MTRTLLSGFGMALGHFRDEFLHEEMKIRSDLLHLNTQVVVSEERRDRDDETADRRKKCRSNTGSDGINVDFAHHGDFTEGDHHADDRSEEPHIGTARDTDGQEYHAAVKPHALPGDLCLDGRFDRLHRAVTQSAPLGASLSDFLATEMIDPVNRRGMNEADMRRIGTASE